MNKRKVYKKFIIVGCLCIVAAILALAINLISISIPASVKGSLFGSCEKIDSMEGELREDGRAPEGMKLVTENDELAMFFNDTTSELALLDKTSQEWWYTNPADADQDSSDSASVIAKMKSILQVKYYSQDDNVGILNSWHDCVESGTLAYEFIPGGIRMVFEIGKEKVTREMLPAVVQKDKFEEQILSKVSEEERKLLEAYYRLQKLSEVKSPVVANKYRELYTTIDEDAEYYFLDLYTPEYQLEPFYRVLYESAGYSVSHIEADHAEVGYHVAVDSFIRFGIPVEFTLEGDSLHVSIPASEITAPGGCRLAELSLLPYFGCAGLDAEGYLFVPDGSGALIGFNNNKKSVYSYLLPVYGEDSGIEQSEVSFSTAKANIPVFGIAYKDQKSMLAVIEQGDSHGVIEAEVSGMEGDQNRVGARFELTPMTVESFSDKQVKVETNMYQEEPYRGRISIKYLFAGKDKADYSGLACMYRDYLQETGVLKEQGKDAAQFQVKLTSRIVKETSLLGIPYKTAQTVTSFTEAGEIINRLKQAGVGDMNVGISSWFGGGLRNAPVTGSVSIASGMGGKKAFARLISEMEGYGEIALGADLLKVYEGWPHFNQYLNAARFLNNSLAVGYSFNPATLRENKRRDAYYYLSSRYFEGVLKEYTSSVNRYGVSKLWLTDAGTVLASDFGSSGAIDREVSKELIVEAVSEAAKTNGITASDPNQYLWRYLDAIVDLPLHSSEHTIIDESVPFLQMVLSGHLNYASKAFNRSGSADGYFLKAAETGGDIYYEWIYESDVVVSGLKGIDTEEVYSMCYENWIDLAAEQYTRMKRELSCVAGKEITHHSMLEEGVSETRYGSISVIVNYNEYDVTVDGEIVGARDFKVRR